MRRIALEARLAVHHVLHRLLVVVILLVNRLGLSRPRRLASRESASRLARRPSGRAKLLLRHDEGLDGEDLATKVGKGDAGERIEREDALQDAVGVVGDGEDGAEEIGVAEVRAEGLV